MRAQRPLPERALAQRPLPQRALPERARAPGVHWAQVSVAPAQVSVAPEPDLGSARSDQGMLPSVYTVIECISQHSKTQHKKQITK